MVRNIRRGHNGAFKAKGALEAVKGEKTLAQLSSEFGVHANQIGLWRKQLIKELPSLFADRGKKRDKQQDELISELYRQIGQLKVEVDWLKKKSHMLHGFVYLVAIMDWYSRFVLEWEIATPLDIPFCLSALEKALEVSTPEIFNTDQGGQFTSREFTGRLEKEDIRISMDGRGRVYDNIFVERLWRSVKYEEVYLHHYQTVSEARSGLARYFLFYNMERVHESLGYQTPYEVYVKERVNINPVRASTIHLIQPYFLS